jgi:hypothetical protein
LQVQTVAMKQGNLPHTRLRGLLALAVLLASFGGPVRVAWPKAEHPLQQASFTLDNVGISLSTTSLPSAEFTTAEPGSANQVADAVSWQPYRELAITAIPFGTKPGTESVPIAQPGGAGAYYSALRSARLGQGGQIFNGPRANLFGQSVVGQATVVSLNLDGPVPKPTLIVEWVVEAGQRLWIVRASQEPTTEGAGGVSASALSSFSDLELASHTLDNPSTVRTASDSLPGPIRPARSAGELATPAWWNGDCDHVTYQTRSGGLSSYRLGAVYLGMPACGPRPFADHAPDVVVRFAPHIWGVLEWECVELSMRFIYLANGVHAYPANGSQVVWNYSSSADGGSLQKIGNGSPNAAPQPGDVLSYGATSTVGHTSVVMSATVDMTGTGNINVIEENNSVSGTSTLSMVNWYVKGNSGSVSGWLHKPSWVASDAVFFPLVMN